jgi:hypothetical protein
MDEEHKGEEPEVEAHIAEDDDDDNDVEAHIRKAHVRMDLPRKG